MKLAYLCIWEDDHEPCVSLIYEEKEYFFGYLTPPAAFKMFNMLKTKEGIETLLIEHKPDPTTKDWDEEERMHLYKGYSFNINQNANTPAELTDEVDVACNWQADSVPYLKIDMEQQTG